MKNTGILKVLVLILFSLSFSNCKPEKRERTIHIVKYPNGNIKSISQTLNEKNDGIRYEYYPNRQLMLKENWVDGFKNGKILSFYENGTIETEGSYLRDKKMAAGNHIILMEEFGHLMNIWQTQQQKAQVIRIVILILILWEMLI